MGTDAVYRRVLIQVFLPPGPPAMRPLGPRSVGFGPQCLRESLRPRWGFPLGSASRCPLVQPTACSFNDQPRFLPGQAIPAETPARHRRRDPR